jgi:bacillithiol biosynthesis cysteine-adding enzyme BshC
VIPRIVATPLTGALSWPGRRSGGIADGLLPAFLGSETSLARLKQPEVLVVTTGQQPGLLTGPLYTFYKALSAAALAGICQERWGRVVVPVFWSAGDDHDFAEASHAAWFAADGSVVTATLRSRLPEAPLTPLYREPLGPEIVPLLDRLAGDLPVSDERGKILDLLRRHYRPEVTLAGSCASTLAELLGPLGVVVFDPTHPAAKQAQAPLLMAALRQGRELDRALVVHLGAMPESERPDMTVGEGASLVMLEGDAGRDRLVFQGTDGFVARRGGQSFTLAALETLGRDEPQRFSPNVLLRPVVESALLPTICYLGGPAELRYLALAEALYPPLEVPCQSRLPRWSGILVEPRVDRVLEKFEAPLSELLEPGRRLESRVARDQLPGEATQALAALREAIGRHYDTLVRSAVSIDPTLERTIRRLQHQALAGAEDTERRLISHLKKREGTESQQIARARDAVLPLGRPQERVLTGSPWLARYGTGLLDELARAITAWYRAGLEASAPVS